MKVVVFGLTISSAWANGHATLWRGLCRALHTAGHEVVFFERDVSYYAQHRDMWGADWCQLLLYANWPAALDRARAELRGADVGIVTSYCMDGVDAARVVLDSAAQVKVFYDLDSPVTLDALSRGEAVPYLPPEGLGGFDLVLSYAGGRTLDGLKRLAGARVTAPLYGSVDPDTHYRVPPEATRANDLSYVGTYAADRQPVLEEFFLAPARVRPERRFVLAGSQYPEGFGWTPNMLYLQHLAPADHAGLYCSSLFTLNVTRAAMAASGYCPSGRLFEATACGVPVITDWWEGLDTFFAPGDEVVIARSTADVLAAFELPAAERLRLGSAAQTRTLEQHTAAARVRELERLLEPSWRDAQRGAA